MQGGIVINKNDLMNTIQSLEEKGIEGIGAYELSRILKSSRKEIGECLIELYDDGLLQKKADNPSKYVLVKKRQKIVLKILSATKVVLPRLLSNLRWLWTTRAVFPF